MDKRRRLFRWVAVGAAALAAGLWLAGLGIEAFRPRSEGAKGRSKDAVQKPEALEARLKRMAPKGIFIVIDTGENRLRVMSDGKVEREVVVSCGSGDILDEPGGRRRWQFDTPRGEFEVTSKLVNPTWIKPDWAFIEEGEKPPKDFNSRVDNDSLGDYALGFGDGFFIHGTLYTRLLGRNVTHGCVRVGDKDLEEVFRRVPMGARIFIF
jgi:L,D-transpeptidase YbiS